MRAAACRSFGLLAIFALVTGACVPKRLPDGGPGAPTISYALYRAALEEEGERSRRFRLLVFAEPPDRLHVEVLLPTGGTAWILDAGGGRVSLAEIRERVVYVGADVGEAFESTLGLSLTVRDLVGLLRAGGEAPDGVLATRRPPEGNGYPERLEVARQGRRLTLERIGEERPGTAAPELGTGLPPRGFEIRPLRDLPGAERAAWWEEGA